MTSSSVQGGNAGAAAEGPVVRAFHVLECLAQAREPMRLSAVARALDLQKSTVHRMLGLLAGLGYVEQVPETACYRTTLRMWEMGQAVVGEHPIKRVAGAFLLDLHRTTRETVSLTILSGDDVLYLDKLIAPRPARFLTRVGSRVPALLTAGGKAMLAHAHDGRAISKRCVGRIGRKFDLTLDGVLQELEQVRAQGYAVCTFDAGVISMATPVMARDGQAAAAISVSAPLQRVNDSKRAEMIEHLLNTSADLAERVGAL